MKFYVFKIFPIISRFFIFRYSLPSDAKIYYFQLFLFWKPQTQIVQNKINYIYKKLDMIKLLRIYFSFILTKPIIAIMEINIMGKKIDKFGGIFQYFLKTQR